MNKGELIYQTKPDRGFVFKAWELLESKGNALIEIERDGKLLREFKFPAYKVWNIPAHSNDIIQSELDKDVDGYLVAGSDGLGGNVFGRQSKKMKNTNKQELKAFIEWADKNDLPTARDHGIFWWRKTQEAWERWVKGNDTNVKK